MCRSSEFDSLLEFKGFASVCVCVGVCDRQFGRCAGVCKLKRLRKSLWAFRGHWEVQRFGRDVMKSIPSGVGLQQFTRYLA